MTTKNEAEFRAHIKNDPLCRVYLLYGSEPYLVSLYDKALRKKAVTGSFEEFNYKLLDGGRFDMRRLADSMEALPFMSERVCVVLEDMDLSNLNAAQLEDLLKLLADPPQTTTLIMTAKTYDFSGDKAKKLIKAADKVGCVAKLDSRTAGDMNKFIRELAARNGCTLSAELAGAILEKCTNQMESLKNEIGKLCAYAGGGTLTAAQVDLVCTTAVQAKVFDLSKAILSQSYDKAFTMLDDLIYLREDPIKILTVLGSAFVDLYRAKLAGGEGCSAEKLCTLFDSYKGKEWRIKYAMRDSSGHSTASLGRAVELLANADYTVKSTRCEPRLVLEQTVTGLFLALQG